MLGRGKHLYPFQPNFNDKGLRKGKAIIWDLDDITYNQEFVFNFFPSRKGILNN